MRVAAIDSAPELSGLAVLGRDPGGRERLLHHRAAPALTCDDVDLVVAELLSYAPDLVALEDAFFSPKEPSAGLVLARLLGRWMQVFETRGLTCVCIPAPMWRRGVLRGLLRPRAPRDECKRAAVTWARASFGVEVTHDEADAIGLGAYVLRNAIVRARAA